MNNSIISHANLHIFAFSDAMKDLMDWNTEQLKRREHIKGVCHKMNNFSQIISNISSIQARPTMLVDEKHRVIFCYIAKVGCTSWKWLFIALQEEYNISHPEILNITVHDTSTQIKHGLKPLKQYSSDQIKYRLEHFHKIMAVRNPIGRIISAFNDKFVPFINPMKKGEETCEFCKVYSNVIRKHSKHNYTKTSHNNTSVGNLPREELSVNGTSRTHYDEPRVSLEEFIQYITSKRGSTNRHWKPFYALCNPCGVDYDYIVKMETLTKDTHVLLPLIFNTTVEFPRANQIVKKVLSNVATTSDIPERLRGSIKKWFGRDMELFDYTYPWD